MELNDEDLGIIRSGLNALVHRMEKARDKPDLTAAEKGGYDAQIRRIAAVKRKIADQGETE